MVDARNIPEPGYRDLRLQAGLGETEAMDVLLNRALSHKGVTVRTTRKGIDLQIDVEAEPAPDEKITTTLIRRELVLWRTEVVEYVEIYSRKTGEDTPAWSQQLSLSSLAVSEYQTPVPSPAPENQVTSFLEQFRFDYVKLVLVGLLALYGYFGALDSGYNGPFRLLHYPDLAIHETGHLLFMIVFGGGSFMHILGGSLTQILFPLMFGVYFYWSGQRFSSAVALFWTAQNFMDVAVYVKDAQARALPLTSPDPNAHDWYNLLTTLNVLQHDQAIGNFVHAVGVLLLVGFVVLGLYSARDLEPLRSSD